MVVYNDKIYSCDTAHTSVNPFDYTKWHEISKTEDIPLWQTSTDYSVGNLVIKDNQLYRCKTAHTSDNSDFYADTSKWDVLDTKWVSNTWVANKYYHQNEIVLYDNTIYKCNTGHLSLSTFELDKANWEILNANIRQWASGTIYKVGDTVLFENEIWKCITANNDNSFYYQKWQKISKCNISIWKAAPDPDTLALLHFDIPSDIGRNEYGSPFSSSGSRSSGGKWGNAIDLNSGGVGVTSPDYSFNNNETYTLEFWMWTKSRGFGRTCGVIGSLGTIYKDRNYDDYMFVDTSYAKQITAEFDPGNVWMHYAFIITPTECTVYIGGRLFHQFTRPNSDPINIGFYGVEGDSYRGLSYVDELRISKGARYTAEFTPYTEPFNDPNFSGYVKDDLIVYEDKIYKALVANNDVVFDYSKWVEVSKTESIQLWEASKQYLIGDIVINGNKFYRCTTANTDATFDGAKWDEIGALDMATTSDIDELFI